MKKIKPKEEVTICDICHREAIIISKCPVCGCDYCLICDAIIGGCIHKIDICRKCGKREDVQEISKKYAPKIARVILARSKELKNLKAPDKGGEE